jgi:hypothetical protein
MQRLHYFLIFTLLLAAVAAALSLNNYDALIPTCNGSK